VRLRATLDYGENARGRHLNEGRQKAFPPEAFMAAFKPPQQGLVSGAMKADPVA